MTIKEIIASIQNGEKTALEITNHYLNRIEEHNPKINAFIEVFADEARHRAEAIDQKIKQGEPLGALAGVPVAIKDNILYEGHIASASSKMLDEYTATYSATVIRRLLEADAIIIGRTNMDEFAMGSSTENSAFGPTINPWGENKIPGGSSGGSASAVSADLVPVALGSDTGGSIRQPASMVNVVGFKPTYGRVSRYGLIAMSSSLDQIGPFTKTVTDNALVMSVIEGRDEKDSTSLDLDETFSPDIQRADLKGIKIGIPKEYFVDGMDSDVEQVIRESIEKLKSAGAEIVDVSIPLTEYALSTYYIIQPAETSSNLARFDGMRYGHRADADNLLDSYLKTRGELFGREVKRRILLGNYILSAGYYDAYYKRALAVKTALHQQISEVMKSVDAIVAPTSPTVAWSIGEKVNDPVSMYLSDIFSVSANIVGIPAISVPCGFAHDLPVGLQFMGSHGEDIHLLRVASAFQELTDAHLKDPK